MTIITAGAIAAVYENEITVMLWSPGEASIAIAAFDSILNTINTSGHRLRNSPENYLHTANDLQMILLYLQKLTATELRGQNWTGTLCTVPCVGPKITIRQHQRSPYEFVLYSALSSETEKSFWVRNRQNSICYSLKNKNK